MEKNNLTELISKSLDKLALNDDEIFKIKLPEIPKKNAENKATQLEKILNRELHETTLNHRLAFYLENEFIKENIRDFFVDIEYNRNFGNSKSVIIERKDIPIRPDILIHKRMSKDIDRHLLVIEAKKGKTSKHDVDKVQALMKDKRYLYMYGLTISYSGKHDRIIGILYYKNDLGKIQTEKIEVLRKNCR